MPSFHEALLTATAVVYGLLAVAGGWTLLSGPGGWALVALAGAAVAGLVTAVVAAPAHGRLAGGHDVQRIRRLLRADRIRAVAVTVALLAAVMAAVSAG